MGLHWNVSLELVFETDEQAVSFSKAVNYDEEEEMVRFTFDDNDEASFIYMGNNGSDGPSINGNAIFYHGECSSRFVGDYNVEDFFHELKNIATEAHAVIQHIEVTFMSQEDDGYYKFFSNFSDAARQKLLADRFDHYIDDFGEDEAVRYELNLGDDHEVTPEDIELFKKTLQQKYDSCVWMLFLTETADIQDYIEEVDDGRESLFEFADEIEEFAQDAIKNFVNPQDIFSLVSIKDGMPEDDLWD